MADKPDIFLSYSREDQETARRFAEGLKRAGLSVWWDATLRSGDAYDTVTEKALKSARAVVVLWSKTSVESRWVRAEATLADRNHTLMPVMIEPCERPIMFELTHTADLSHWKGDPRDKAWMAYVEDVRSFVQQDDTSAESRVNPSTTTTAAAHPRRSFARVITIAIAALLVAGGASLLWRHLYATAGSQPDQDLSIAVLPFENLSNDPDQDYFSDGFASDLGDQLGEFNELRIIPSTSSSAFKGQKEDVRVIGEKLGARYLVEGNLRSSGDRVLITVKLTDTRSNTQLWSDKFQDQLKSVFDIRSEIVAEIATRLSVKLDVGDLSSRRGGTTNLDAYDYYLRARQIKQRSVGNLDKARALLWESVKADPDFETAWRELGDTLIGIQSFSSRRLEEVTQEQNQVFSQIERFPPDAWQTHALRAAQFREQHRWQQAEAEADIAVRDAPRSLLGSAGFYTIVMNALGRPSAATPIVERNADNDRLSVLASNLLQNNLYFSGRLEESYREYQRGMTLDGNKGSLTGREVFRLMALPDARTPAGIARLREYVAGLGWQNRLLDDLADGKQRLAQIRHAVDNPEFKESNVLMGYAVWADYYGDKDLALAALRKGTQLNAPLLGYIWLPFHTDLRADPRFKVILEDLGIADYFRATNNYGEFCYKVEPDNFGCR